MAMNEQLLDDASKKNKVGFFSKLVNAGFKKKDIEDKSPITETNYSNIELRTQNEPEDRSNISSLQEEAMDPLINSNEEDINLDEAEGFMLEQESKDINNEDSVENNFQEEVLDDLLTMHDEQSSEIKSEDDTLEIKEDDLEIPSFLKRQAN
jgi:hypothetical protein